MIFLKALCFVAAVTDVVDGVMGLRCRRLLIWLMAALVLVLGYLLLTFDMMHMSGKWGAG